MNNVFLILKREYLKVIRKPSFWLTTLAFPAFMVVITLISGFSAESADQRLADFASQVESVAIYDPAGFINPALIAPPARLVTNLDAAKGEIVRNELGVLIAYPEDLLEGGSIQIIAQDLGILSQTIFDGQARELVRQSVLLELPNPEKLMLVNSEIPIEFTAYKDGRVAESGITRAIVPLISVVIYFTLITFATSYLLLSVSEEKENRMIETVLSLVKPRELILGKILGQMSIVLTQMLFLITLLVGAIAIFGVNLPVEIPQIQITLGQVVGAIFYLLVGFFIMASIMVGSGAAMPTYKEAQSLSSIFIVLSLLPFYVAALIIAEPSGTIAQVFSYFPLTAPMILMFRNALGELSALEAITSGAVLILFAGLSYWLAFKLFEFGAMEYNRKVSLKQLFANLDFGRSK